MGTEIASLGDGSAVLLLGKRQELLQQDGFIHGSVLAYLADNAITFAGGSVLGPKVLTASGSVDHLQPASGDMVAKAQVIASTARKAIGQCEIAVNGLICAIANGSVKATS